MTDGLRINAERAVFEIVDNEVIVIDLLTGHYFHATGSGALIWQALTHTPTEASLLAALHAAYPGTAALDADLSAFLSQLREAQVLIADPAGNDTIPALTASGPYQPPALVAYTNMADLLTLDPIHDVDDKGWPHQA